METEAQIRNKLVKKVLEIPKKQLQSLTEFVTKLEQKQGKTSSILAFSGVWKDLDNSVFNDLTENLIKNRQSKRNPIDE